MERVKDLVGVTLAVTAAAWFVYVLLTRLPEWARTSVGGMCGTGPAGLLGEVHWTAVAALSLCLGGWAAAEGRGYAVSVTRAATLAVAGAVALVCACVAAVPRP